MTKITSQSPRDIALHLFQREYRLFWFPDLADPNQVVQTLITPKGTFTFDPDAPTDKLLEFIGFEVDTEHQALTLIELGKLTQEHCLVHA